MGELTIEQGTTQQVDPDKIFGYTGWTYEWAGTGTFGSHCDGGGNTPLEFGTREEAEQDLIDFTALLEGKCATDLARMVDREKGTFTWGKLVCVHEIGDYQVVEFYPRVGAHTGKEVEFHAFVNAKDVRSSFKTMDEALVAAISFKHTNSVTAGFYALRVLDI